jgi:hypothetical protein
MAGRLVPCEIAWRAVFSFVAACCFARTTSDEGTVDTAEGAMLWMRCPDKLDERLGLRVKKLIKAFWRSVTIHRI